MGQEGVTVKKLLVLLAITLFLAILFNPIADSEVKYATVNGHITTWDGSPVSEATVTVTSHSDLYGTVLDSQTTTSGADGSYAVYGLTEGYYYRAVAFKSNLRGESWSYTPSPINVQVKGYSQFPIMTRIKERLDPPQSWEYVMVEPIRQTTYETEEANFEFISVALPYNIAIEPRDNNSFQFSFYTSADTFTLSRTPSQLTFQSSDGEISKTATINQDTCIRLYISRKDSSHLRLKLEGNGVVLSTDIEDSTTAYVGAKYLGNADVNVLITNDPPRLTLADYSWQGTPQESNLTLSLWAKGGDLAGSYLITDGTESKVYTLDEDYSEITFEMASPINTTYIRLYSIINTEQQLVDVLQISSDSAGVVTASNEVSGYSLLTAFYIIILIAVIFIILYFIIRRKKTGKW